MSIDSEDSPLEQALRNDLPTNEAAARMRRRLLAAGLAVGNGMAATTAAAAGTAPGLIAGTVAKVSALSWGVKVGFAAAIAIPSLGLLAERATHQPVLVASTRAPVQAAPSPHEAAAPAAREPAPQPREPAPQPREPAPDAPVAPGVEPASTPVQPAAPLGASVAPEAKASLPEPATGPARPSQVQFEMGEAPITSKAGSTLAEETRILDAAFAELASGNQARAAQLIREHEARFPNGLLERERRRAKARLNEVFRGE